MTTVFKKFETWPKDQTQESMGGRKSWDKN
jgi:hypothetical protein